ncbi:transposase [Polycladomyces sp. WAk]|uniref:Transposase n=1 Tax=Polycladomyces zharkentensis TaxID=2807616 RepID=A0ABS2WMM0_9BACL|nr:zinc ribbon domain-containing protein [Polycladomyces sp. WAk]MBN2910817.1 transposase [Polycladomyces sp. WAk]
MEVDPRHTSQVCSKCGRIVKKALKERTHCCSCGYVADRDVNAARNILHRAMGTVLEPKYVQ